MPLPSHRTFPGSTAFPVRDDATRRARAARRCARAHRDPARRATSRPAATTRRGGSRRRCCTTCGWSRTSRTWPRASPASRSPRTGGFWSPQTRELRQVAPGGDDRLLKERNRRDALIKQVEEAAQNERRALQRGRAAAGQGRRGRRRSATRSTARPAPPPAPATRPPRPSATPATSSSSARPRPTRARAPTARPRSRPRSRPSAGSPNAPSANATSAPAGSTSSSASLERDEQLKPVAERFAARPRRPAASVLATRVEALEAELNADRAVGEKLAAELRECAAEETRVHQRLRERGEAVTRGEVQAQRARDHAQDAEEELTRLATKLGLEPEPSDRPAAGRREGHAAHPHRAPAQAPRAARPGQPARAGRVQGGARARQRARGPAPRPRDRAARAPDPDPRHRPPDQGVIRGDVRRRGQELRGGRRAPLPGRPRRAAARQGRQRPTARPRRRGDPTSSRRARRGRGGRPEDDMGVEIEITPAGKSTKRLTLLSGGEKSMTALAFLFAVFLARPCPFYILDEVEAALDDLNIDRFLKVLRSFSGRAQFIVVTHQKRTMEAADSLYGVSMAGNGVSKVISRRLPQEQARGRMTDRSGRPTAPTGSASVDSSPRPSSAARRRRLGRRWSAAPASSGSAARRGQRGVTRQRRRSSAARASAAAPASSAPRASSSGSATSAARPASRASAASTAGLRRLHRLRRARGAVGQIGVHAK